MVATEGFARDNSMALRNPAEMWACRDASVMVNSLFLRSRRSLLPKPTPDLGNKLRRLRRKRELTITEASRQAHISAGFLSAIELSRANPSVATIYRLAAAYGTTVLELYDFPVQSNRVLRPRRRQSLETKSGVRMELLSTGTKMLESMLI